jgi:hypothetical protein
VSTPGGDKPDLPDFSDFDLPTDGLDPQEDSSLPDLPGDDLIAMPEPLEEAKPAELSFDDVSPSDEAAPAEEAEALAFPADDASASAMSAEAKPAEEESPKKKKKAAKPKKEKKAKAGNKEGIFQRLAKASPYTVLLGLSVVALVIAVVCLIVELARFNYDVKAQEAKQRAAVTAPSHSAAARTTTAA